MKEMNIKELREWFNTVKLVDTTLYNYDNNGNEYVTEIYEKDGELFSQGFCNGYPSAKWSDECGWMSERDENGDRIKENGKEVWIYEPLRVRKISKTTIKTEVEYVPENTPDSESDREEWVEVTKEEMKEFRQEAKLLKDAFVQFMDDAGIQPICAKTGFTASFGRQAVKRAEEAGL